MQSTHGLPSLAFWVAWDGTSRRRCCHFSYAFKPLASIRIELLSSFNLCGGAPGTTLSAGWASGDAAARYAKASNGTGAAEALDKDPRTMRIVDWSRDRHYLIEETGDPKTGFDIWVVPQFGCTWLSSLDFGRVKCSVSSGTM